MRLDAILVALVALAWVPANHYHPWPSAWQDGIALFLVVGSAVCISRRAHMPLVWLASLALALLSVLIQAVSGKLLFAGDAWIVATYLAGFGLAVAAGATLVRDGPGKESTRLELLCLALLAAALFSAGVGFAQWAGVLNLGIFGADLPPNSRPFANFGQPNHWCTASLIGLGAAWVLFEARRIGPFVFGLLSAVMLIAMVVSGSRTAWLQLGAGTAIFLWLSSRASLRLRPWAAGLALAGVLVAWLVWPVLGANVDAQPGAVRSIAEQTRGGIRVPLWQAMLAAIAERPLLGYGWQQMVLAQQAVALERPPLNIHFEHSHNLLLDLAVWAGLPVALTLTVLAGWGLWRVLKETRDARAAGLLLAVAGVLAHSMVEFAIEYAYFLLPMGLMIGAAERLTASPPAAVVVSKGVLRFAGAAVLALLVLVAMDYLEAEQSHRALRLESARIGTERVESPPPQLRVLTQLEAFQVFARAEPRSGATAAEVEFARRVAQRFAYPPAQFRLARWQALHGDVDAAAQTLRLLCAMHPINHCRDAVNTWTSLATEQPALRAVPLPAVGR